MFILACDTSSTSGSIALHKDSQLISELTVGDVGMHANWFLKTLDEFLKDSGLTIRGIDVFAVATGPGSFTGLRVGVSTVKGLAWTLNKKIVGVSTLEALALSLNDSGMTVCPIIDARKGQVYAALYASGREVMKTIMQDSVLDPVELFKIANETDESSIIFVGEGLKTYAEAVRAEVRKATIAPEALWRIRASCIATLGYKKIGSGVYPGELSPVYLRKSEAELRRGDH